MPRPSRVQKRLQVVLDRLTPEARRAILKALDELQKAASVEKIVAAMQRGDFWSFQRLTESLPRDLERASRVLRQAFDAGVKAAKVEIGISLKAPNTVAARAADATAAKFVTAVTQETQQAIRTIVSRAFTDGVTVRDIAKQVKPLIGLTERQAKAVRNFRIKNAGLKDVDAKAAKYAEKLLKQRAEMIARTEVIKASTDGKIASWRDARAKGQLSDRLVKTWIVTPDDRLCPVCEPLDGQQASIDGTFSTANGPVIGPPVHPNCLLGHALISPGSGIAAVSQRPFDGDVLVVSTASGKRLACTPNHPVLTDGGWVPASALNVVGHVISRSLGDARMLGRSDDHQNVPASIHEIAEASRRSEQMAAMPVPVASEDFHGDGAGSEVAVIWADGLLVDDINAALMKQAGQDALAAADVEFATLDGLSPSPFFFGGMDATDDGLVRRRDLSGPLLCRHGFPLQSFGGARASDGYAALSESPFDGTARDAELARELKHGRAGLVFRDEVVHVESQSFHGFVYNLQTETAAYVADGIVNHNCRCAVGLVERRQPQRRAA